VCEALFVVHATFQLVGGENHGVTHMRTSTVEFTSCDACRLVLDRMKYEKHDSYQRQSLRQRTSQEHAVGAVHVDSP
jgi:hypothetical protein